MLLAPLPSFNRMPSLTDQPIGRCGSWQSQPDRSLPLNKSIGLPGFLLGGVAGHTGPRTPVHVSVSPRTSAVPVKRASFKVPCHTCAVLAFPSGYWNLSSPCSSVTCGRSKTAPPPALKRPLSTPSSRLNSSQQFLGSPDFAPVAVMSHRPRKASSPAGLADALTDHAAIMNATMINDANVRERMNIPP